MANARKKEKERRKGHRIVRSSRTSRHAVALVLSQERKREKQRELVHRKETEILALWSRDGDRCLWETRPSERMRKRKKEDEKEREKGRGSRATTWSWTWRGRTTSRERLRTQRIGEGRRDWVMSEAPWFNRTRRCAADWPAPLWNAGPPSSCQSVGLGPSVPLPTYTQPPKGPTATSRRSPLPSPITARKRKCGRTFDFMFVCVYVYVRLDDATSRPLTAISAAGHQRVPTGPNRPGQLASVTFARLLPVLSSRSFSFSSSSSRCSSPRSSCSFLFLRKRPFPLSPPLRRLLFSLTRSSL